MINFKGIAMIYEDIKTKHNLTNAQLLHLHALCARFNVDTGSVDDWTSTTTIIGAFRAVTVHVRHSDLVLHIDAFSGQGDTLRGSSWALKPEGEQYALRGIAEV